MQNRSPQSPPASGAVPLSDLAPGATGVVTGVEGPGPIATRLQDLGFLAETRVVVVRRAPLRDPVLYELRGYRISLRRSEASLVQVRRVDAEPARGAAR